MYPVEVTSERLVLRELASSDAEAIHAYASDPEVVRFMHWGPNTRDETLAFLDRQQRAARERTRLWYTLGIVRRDNAALVGSVGLERDEPAASRSAMLGYVLRRDHWNQGWTTDAARAIVTFGFHELGLHRVWATCDEENVASARVMQKIGMTYEGRFRENEWLRGRWRTTLQYAVLEDEWTGSHRP